MRKRAIHSHSHIIGAADTQRFTMPVESLSSWQALSAIAKVGPVVYAARVDELVKIGHTGHVNVRMGQIKGEILAFRFGTVADEQAIHAQLVEYRAKGREWYHPTPEVLAVVNEMRDGLGLEPIAA